MADDALSPFQEEVSRALLEAFREQRRSGYETSAIGQAFFRVWFKEKRGEALFFVFRKNLRTTNLQLAELLALISAHTVIRRTSKHMPELQFVSSDEFATSITALVEAVPARSGPKQRARWFARHYSQLLARTIVVDPFFGTCSVYMPFQLFLDLRIACGVSGYIHSCGRNVFIRNVGKARREHFFEALASYLRRYGPRRKRILFTPFAHEDFRRDDAFGGHELNDLKLFVEKFHMGREHLVEVIAALQERFQKQLEIPDPADVRRHEKTDLVKQLIDRGDIAPGRSMWLLTDYGLTEAGSRSQDRYFICYEQMYHNRNPFQIFDENKPGWIEHNTIPHTLMAALINITRPYWYSSEVTILDPFAGSGTTTFEAAKHTEIRVLASDISAEACAAAHDNSRFFAETPERLRWLRDGLTFLSAAVEDGDREIETPASLNISEAGDVASVAAEVRRWEVGIQKQLDDSESYLKRHRSLVARVAFYLALRAHKRHAPGFRRRSDEWPKAFAREATLLCTQITAFADWKTRVIRDGQPCDDVLSEYTGRYSQYVTVAPDRLEALVGNGRGVQRKRDASRLERWQRKESCDVVVTDPPYGFNTDDDPETLAALYADFLRGAVRALRDGGQLVICLPEYSTIGKTPLGFTHRSIVTHQVMSLAREFRLDAVPSPQSVPRRELFRPPYFWESERALRRSILHFRFRSMGAVSLPIARSA